MPKVRATPILLGVATFLAAHAIEVAARIGGPAPWFISAYPSALFTAGLMFSVGLWLGLREGRGMVDAFLSGVLLAAGAAVPLVITLFAHPSGPGNLFPFAVMLGVGLLAVSSVAGVVSGWLLQRVTH